MARERKKVEEPNELRWLTTYGDVVTLLLAFFVMLYAISQVDQQKFQMFVSGLADPFHNPAVSEGLLNASTGLVGAELGDGTTNFETFGAPALLDGLPDVNTSNHTTQTTVQPPNENTDPDPGSGVSETDGNVIVNDEQLIRVRDAISVALEDAGLVGAVDFEITARGLVIAIATDHVLFASGSAEFGENGDAIIAAVAPTLVTFDNEILVEGHTDTVPLNRNGYDNWNLSTDRALAVLKALTGWDGIDPARLAATGYGEFRPRASNETDEGKAANRRVELVVVVDRGDTNG
ncbi:MAG: flagellar motor protein MotB [Acidimicrobiia bacterium]|jgi:chemotaxis protein MotB